MSRSSRAPSPTTSALDAGACAEPTGSAATSYEEALGELERLVSEMESGQMPLDRLLEGYQRAASLLAYCRDRLRSVEDQVRILEDGQLRPWVDEPARGGDR